MEAKQPTASAADKPGQKTTEFWMHGGVAATALMVAHHSTNPYVQGGAMLIAAACSVDYRIGRTAAKRSTVITHVEADDRTAITETTKGGAA
jgi:hypothetical protein